MNIDWESLNKPSGVNNLIDDLTFTNYKANRARGMSHESLAGLLSLSDGKAEFYKDRYELENENE